MAGRSSSKLLQNWTERRTNESAFRQGM